MMGIALPYKIGVLLSASFVVWLEVVAFQIANTPVDWLVANAGMGLTAGAGFMAYGALRKAVTVLEGQHVEHQRLVREEFSHLRDGKAEKVDLTAMESRIDERFRELREMISAFDTRLDASLNRRGSR